MKSAALLGLLLAGCTAADEAFRPNAGYWDVLSCPHFDPTCAFGSGTRRTYELGLLPANDFYFVVKGRRVECWISPGEVFSCAGFKDDNGTETLYSDGMFSGDSSFVIEAAVYDDERILLGVNTLTGTYLGTEAP